MPEPLPISYDTETTGLDLHKDSKMFAFSTCEWNGHTEVHRVDRPSRAVVSQTALERVFENTKRGIVFHNAKFDLLATEKHLGRVLTPRVFHDTYIQSHILMNNHPSRKLKQLAWELARVPIDDQEKVLDSLDDKEYDYSRVPEEIMHKYQERDAIRTMLLHRFFYPKIQANPRWMDIYRNEMDLIPVTMKMERRGFMLNRKKCQEVQAWCGSQAISALDDIERICGRRVHPRKPGDLYWMLFDFADLPILNKTKTGKPATDKETLALMRQQCPHPLLDLLAKYRSYDRGVSILGSYMELADSNDIIHPSLNTCKAITGRESSSRPNLQNVEKTGVLLNPFPVPARLVFRPRPGYVNFHIDYAGIELRLLVFYSREPQLLEVVRANGDPHDLAAQLFFEDAYRNAEAKLKKTIRTASKNCNFAIPYGAGADTVAATLGKSIAEGHKLLAKYRAQWPKLAGLSRTIASNVGKTGYVTTAFGRVLRLPRSQAYMGTNYLIQGTAAEILKRAQVRVDAYLEKHTGGELGIILPIHDELIIECPRSRLRDAHEILLGVREVMIDFPQFDLPLEVEADVATVDWEHKNKYPLAA